MIESTVDASPQRRSWFTPTAQSWCALVASVLWLWGIGSVIGVLLGVRLLRSATSASGDRQRAVAAVVLGVIGVLVTVGSFLLLEGASSG